MPKARQVPKPRQVPFAVCGCWVDAPWLWQVPFLVCCSADSVAVAAAVAAAAAAAAADAADAAGMDLSEVVREVL